jgi:hypothetical protein
VVVPEPPVADRLLRYLRQFGDFRDAYEIVRCHVDLLSLLNVNGTQYNTFVYFIYNKTWACGFAAAVNPSRLASRKALNRQLNDLQAFLFATDSLLGQSLK